MTACGDPLPTTRPTETRIKMPGMPTGQSGDTSQLPQVAVVTAANGETELRQTIADENQLRASLGLPEITIVDLRTSAR